MSEFELVTLRNRLIRGVQNKAARGELFLSVPIGYVKLPSGEVVKEPDEQARSMVELVFSKFDEIGSAHGVFRYLADHQLKMGFRVHKGPCRGELEFRLPTPHRVLNILKHPIYAGAYGYGMRRNSKMHRNLDKYDEKGWFLRPEDMGVCLKDRLPAYITWEQFLSNQARLQENRSSKKSKGIPRRGDALLAGLVRCGKCERQMTTSYKTDKLPSYSCNEFMRNETLQGSCGRLAAKWIDELVSLQVLRAVAPAAIELSQAAMKDIEQERQELHKQWNLKLERARQECDRTRRQYQAVEPENRLVARTLESDWEASLINLQKMDEDYERFRSSAPAALSDQEKLQIQSLSESLPKLWTDDTTVKVLVGGEEGSRQGRFWTYIGDGEHPYSVYDFTMSRSRDGPQKFLQEFQGYLHADAYAGYDAIYLGSDNQIVEVACWAHARRKFYDARQNYPREAHQVLEWIRQLYDIEDRASSLPVAARHELRLMEAEPVLDQLESYLAALTERVLPKSALATAVNYARNQWDALRCYTSDGRLTIDNNTAEGTLRHQAIGRKNWCAPEVPSRPSGRSKARDALLAMFERTVAVRSAICI